MRFRIIRTSLCLILSLVPFVYFLHLYVSSANNSDDRETEELRWHQRALQHQIRALQQHAETEQENHRLSLQTKQPIQIYTKYKPNTKWELDTEECQSASVFKTTKMKTKYGTLDIFIHEPKADKWISKTLVKTGRWEDNYVDLLASELGKYQNAAFLDIGANLGVFSLAIANLGVKVIAFEPLKINVQRMCASLRANNLVQNVTIVKSALSNVSHPVTLGVDVNNVGGSFVVQDQTRIQPKKGHYPDVVMTTTLDDVLQLPGFSYKKIVIKMDVEGYEEKVLKGGVTFFDIIDVPVVLMEWVFHKNRDSGREILIFFKDRRYIPYDPVKFIVLDPSNSNTWPQDVLWRKKSR